MRIAKNARRRVVPAPLSLNRENRKICFIDQPIDQKHIPFELWDKAATNTELPFTKITFCPVLLNFQFLARSGPQGMSCE
jgi:hypothetical protein